MQENLRHFFANDFFASVIINDNNANVILIEVY